MSEVQRKSLGTGRGQTIYRFRGNISKEGEPLEQLYAAGIKTILDFLESECMLSFPPESRDACDFDVRELHYCAKCRTIPGIFVWCMSLRFIKTETASGSEDIYESRPLHYDIGIAEEDGRLEFGLEVASELNSVSSHSELHLRLLGVLAEKVGLREVCILGQVLHVKDAADAELLFELLTNRTRNLPVVVVSELYRQGWSFTPNPPSYLLDASAFAFRALGYGHVVKMTHNGSREWANIGGAAWAVYDGAIRLFKPSFDINFSNTNDHPIFFKDQIWEFRYDHSSGPKTFFAYLLAALRRNASSRVPDRRNIMFQPEADMVKHVLSKMNQCCNVAEKQENDPREQVGDLEKKWQDACVENHEYEAKIMELTERNRDLEAMVRSMQSSIEHLSGYGKDRDATVKNAGEIEIPTSFRDMPAWCEVYLHGRLYLHPRAERAIEKAEYKNPRLVYRALLALAFEYRDSRLGECSERNFKLRCSELGVQKRGSITKSRAGQEGDSYYINYPFHTSNQRLLQWHLVKGNSRKKAFCMRIYFFWDDDSKLVVVGYLPGHLNNRIS